jgi:hypothetical protein
MVVMQCVDKSKSNATRANVLAEASRKLAFIMSKLNMSFKTLDGILSEGILANKVIVKKNNSHYKWISAVTLGRDIIYIMQGMVHGP